LDKALDTTPPVEGFALGLLRKLAGSRLAGIALWSFAAAVVARISNLAAMVVCARVLPQDGFGQVAIIQSTVGTFAPIAGLGLSVTATKFIAEYRDTDVTRAGRILALSLTAAALAGALMTGALVLFAPWIARVGFATPGLADQLVQASGLLFLGVIESVQTGVLTGLEAFPRIARLSAWNGFISVPLIGVLVMTRGTEGAIAGLTISLLLACSLNAWALRSECRKWGIQMTFQGCASERSVLVQFSLPSYLSGIMLAPVTWLTTTLLVHRPNGLSEIALFSAADRYRYLLIFIPLAVSRIAVPTFSRALAAGDAKGYQEAFRWNTIFGLMTTLPPVFVCVLFSGILMSLFGEPFRRGWPVMAILAVSAIPTVMNTQLGAALLSNGRAWARTWIDGLLAATFLGAAWFLIPYWDAAGLALAFATAYSVACVALMICLRGARAAE
jgi:O-antigen/teichoic acid export membrane protein